MPAELNFYQKRLVFKATHRKERKSMLMESLTADQWKDLGKTQVELADEIAIGMGSNRAEVLDVMAAVAVTVAAALGAGCALDPTKANQMLQRCLIQGLAQRAKG